jgi:hypothetical protein
MKDEYIKIAENDPTKKARAILKRLNEKEYEMVKFEAPIELIDGGLGEQLLQEIVDDADKEGVTLHVDINKMLIEK